MQAKLGNMGERREEMKLDAVLSGLGLKLNPGALTMDKVVHVLLLILVGVVVIRVVLKLLDRVLARSKSLKSLSRYIHSVAKISMAFILVLMVAEDVGIHTTSLVAMLSVAGLAVSLALQNTLSNVAGGIMLLVTTPFQVGDYVEADGISGTVHAIKTGTLILETQQSSDVTYRLYDYDRPGTDGKLRPLHIEQSLDCIDFDSQAPTDGTVTAPEVDGVTELESNPCYTVDRVRVNGSKTLDQHWPFMCLSVIDGEGTVCGDPVHKGSHLLAPSTVSSIDLEGKMELIISHL